MKTRNVLLLELDKPATSLTSLSHFASVTKREFRADDVRCMIVMAKKELLAVIEGDTQALESAKRKIFKAANFKQVVEIDHSSCDQLIVKDSLRLVPLGSAAHSDLVKQLKLSNRSSIQLSNPAAVELWNNFATWQPLNKKDLSSYNDKLLSLADWPSSSDIVLNDDQIIICAIMMGRYAHYRDLIKRNILAEPELVSLLQDLDLVGALQTRDTRLNNDENADTEKRSIFAFRKAS